MTLLGTVGMLGLGTLLMGRLPRQPESALALLSTTLAVTAAVCALLGLGFGLVAGVVAPALVPPELRGWGLALFALGVVLTGVTLVLDQALLGLLLGGIQLQRNVVFAVAKLAALLAAWLWLDARSGAAIFATWVFGVAVSLPVLARIRSQLVPQTRPASVDLGLLRGMGREAMLHHGLNLALMAPGLVLPMIVTTRLSAEANAGFYIAWMLTNFVFIGPSSLATVLYAVGAGDTAALAHKSRFTLRTAALIGLAGVAAAWIGADWALRIFGSNYAEQAAWSVRLLSLGVFPLIIKDHFVAICRVKGQAGRAARLVGGLCLFELTLAGVGVWFGGLSGLCLAWVLALCAAALFMVRSVYATAAPGSVPAVPGMSGRWLS
jgi:O-antigen/teichoic acid export membrane protein